MWMNTGRDWDSCRLQIQRIQEQKHESLNGWKAIQGRDVKLRYPGQPEKAEKVMKARRDSGLWYEDADFPGDPDVS